MRIDDETNELNGKIQLICHLTIGEYPDVKIDWKDTAQKLAADVLELIEKLGLPQWGPKQQGLGPEWN